MSMNKCLAFSYNLTVFSIVNVKQLCIIKKCFTVKKSLGYKGV